MNDLAERALHGLDVARIQVRDHPLLSCGVAGFLVSGVAVVAGAQVGAAASTRSLTTWFGLEQTHGARPDDHLPGVLLLAAIVVLVGLWLLVVELVRRQRRPRQRVWLVAAAWAAPFAIGPPLLDGGVYSYAAYGLIQRNGGNPYNSAPTHLGTDPIVLAVEPASRGVVSGAGPLGTVLEHLAVSIGTGTALGAVIVLRVLAVLALAAIGRLATAIGGDRPDVALSLTVLNPLALLYIVSAAHLDGVLIALVLGAVATASRRRWGTAIVLAALAGSVCPPGFFALPLVIAYHWYGRRRRPTAAIITRDLATAAVVVAACGLLVTDGFGWLRTAHSQFSSHTTFAVANAVAKLLTPVVRGASYDDLAAGAQVAAVTAAMCAGVYLVATVRGRPFEQSVGYALLAAGLLAPVLNPWYLLWGPLCLAATATGERRAWVLALSAGGCLLMPPGFPSWVSRTITAAALLIAAAALGGYLRSIRSRGAPVTSRR